MGKRFGGIVALCDVDFSLRAGEVHGVVGGNGAGKSTLMKVLAGALPDYEGTVLLAGQPIRLNTPQASLAEGIAMVYQELSGIGQLSVAENLFLGRQPTTRLGRIDWTTIRRKAREWLADLEIDVEVTRRLDSYPLVVRQMVEIARAVHSGARVLILDEPTSALSPPETRRLFALVQRLRSRGVAIVFISHFIEDVLEICDRVTVLRDGRLVETVPKAGLDKHELIRKMLGHRLEAAEVGYETGVRLRARTRELPVFVAEELSLAGGFSDVCLEVSPGECLGLYGFVGAGHQELVQTLGGARRASSGRVLVDSHPIQPGDPHDSVCRGVVLVTADRAQSLFLKGEIYKNVTLAHLRRVAGRWLMRSREAGATRPVLQRVGCRPPDPLLAAGDLSGGNQQKVVFARWLMGEVRVLLLDEPTRGMDVAAKEDVMRLVAGLKQQGTAVILASSEPGMLLTHADRILVMSRGRVTREFADIETDKAALIRSA
ncbi:MAG: sugar ABC transporter ATP-binding protein [Pirellulales bacterium]|nr:sugar ABC transporter ATP-binding protein [Pirellulales bacterium]